MKKRINEIFMNVIGVVKESLSMDEVDPNQNYEEEYYLIQEEN